MERKPVENSTQIAAIGYNPVAKVLEVEFKTGDVYQYDGVPADMADAFARAPSAGRFLAMHIKGSYEHRKVS